MNVSPAMSTYGMHFNVASALHTQTFLVDVRIPKYSVKLLQQPIQSNVCFLSGSEIILSFCEIGLTPVFIVESNRRACWLTCANQDNLCNVTPSVGHLGEDNR